jgi:hypothetical protein
MVQSSTAQKATGAWKFRTLALLLVVLATHIACFVVLSTQVERRWAAMKATANCNTSQI